MTEPYPAPSFRRHVADDVIIKPYPAPSHVTYGRDEDLLPQNEAVKAGTQRLSRRVCRDDGLKKKERTRGGGEGEGA